MYDAIWNAALPHLSVERMKNEIAEFFELSRWSSFDKINALARLIASKMEASGLEDVRLIEFPADGRTSYGGWVMPEAYDVAAARLSARIDDDPEILLADYAVNPTGLMLYSMPTPHEGIDAEMVVADSTREMSAERLAGKLALTRGVGVAYGEAAMRAGAIGIVSDCRASRRFIKDGAYMDETNEWHNYTIPPWHDPGKGFGFSLSPAQGRVLRAAAAEGRSIRLHAVVRSRHYTGALPVVSGLLRGSTAEEIAITGHYDEYGADDNCSEIAVALEAARAVKSMVEAGQIGPLRRSIRLLFPMEVRGFNALIQRSEEIRNLRAGLNIDTVGTEQNATTSYCSLVETFPAFPSFVDDLAEDLLKRVAAGSPLFRWRREPAETIDNIFGEPLVGAPTPAIYHFSGTHHLAIDTPELISGAMLTNMARLTASYAAFLAGAGVTEALWLMELSAQTGSHRMRDAAAGAIHGCTPDSGASLLRNVRRLHDAARKRVDSVAWIAGQPADSTASAPGTPAQPGSNEIAARAVIVKQDLARSHVNAIAQIRRYAADFFGIDIPEPEFPAPSSPIDGVGGKPVKTFRGFLSFENLSCEERARIERELQIPMGWAAPVWLQNALMYSDGSRNVAEIQALVEESGRVPNLAPIFGYLAELGLVRWKNAEADRNMVSDS
ncbi:MAG TPA: M28 family peptidase [Armatimonadota bacterium]|nr:M28 family peptidase [Armatimonadota bacterium]